MAKYCPILNQKVVYLTCLECDDKPCRQVSTTTTPDNASNIVDSNNKSSNPGPNKTT